MHIKDQVDRRSFLYYPDKDEPCQKGLTRATLAENTTGALHQLLRVKADLGLHIERGTDIELLFLYLPEYPLHIFLAGLAYSREMRGNGLHRLGTLKEAHSVTAEGERWQHM